MDSALIFGTPWPAWVILLLAGGAGALTWRGYKARAGELPPGRLKLLTGLRLAGWALLVICLLQPMRRMYVPEERASRVTVLVDDSESMSFTDKNGGPSRMDRVKDVLGVPLSTEKSPPETEAKLKPDGLLDQLGRGFKWRIEAFGANAHPIQTAQELTALAPRTALAKSLDDAFGRLKGPDAGGLILFSDGADTTLNAESADATPSGTSAPAAPTAPLAALKNIAQAYRRAGIPIYTVGVGSPDPPDLAVVQVRCRRAVSKDTLARVEVEVTRTGLPAGPRTVKIVRNGQIVKEAQVEMPGSKASAIFEFLPPEQGFLEYEAVIEPAPGELLTTNNSLPFGFMAFNRKLKVLYMEGSQYQHRTYERTTWPMRWEWDFLKEALEEDKDVEVDLLLKQEQPEFAGVLKTVKEGYPKKKKDLYQYDVIINSDIPYTYFTPEQVRDTVDFVAKHGGGFCMIGGWDSFGEGHYAGTAFDRMLPVEIDANDTHDDQTFFRWKLPVDNRFDARKHPIMQLDKDPEKNAKIWAMLNSLDEDRFGRPRPAFHGYSKTKRAKPMAEKLAEIDDELLEGLHGAPTLIAVHPFERGFSMAFTTDSTGGWGAVWEDAWGDNPRDPERRNIYYKQFWKNAVRWLAQYRMQAPNQRVLIETEKLVYGRGEQPMIRIKALTEDYEPASDAQVELKLTLPGGKTQTLKAFPRYGEPGIFERLVELPETGRYELEARAVLKKDELGMDKTLLQVRPSSDESRRLGQDAETLKLIAKESGGEYLPLEKSADLPKLLRQDTHVVPRVRDEDLWDRSWIFILGISLLCAEWYFRKKGGLP